MKVPLGNFARSAIEDGLGVDLRAGVQEAIAHYVRRLSSPWRPTRMPGFLEPRCERRDFLELTVAPEVEAELRREAERQRVSMEEILGHAVLVYLADLDLADSPRV